MYKWLHHWERIVLSVNVIRLLIFLRKYVQSIERIETLSSCLPSRSLCLKEYKMENPSKPAGIFLFSPWSFECTRYTGCRMFSCCHAESTLGLVYSLFCIDWVASRSTWSSLWGKVLLTWNLSCSMIDQQIAFHCMVRIEVGSSCDCCWTTEDQTLTDRKLKKEDIFFPVCQSFHSCGKVEGWFLLSNSWFEGFS